MIKKLEYLMDIKKITSAYSFTGDESEADDYISMIEKREYIFNKIQYINRQLEQSSHKPQDDIQERINDVIKNIIDLDKKNKESVEKIKKSLGLKIGEVKAGKKVSAAYHNEILYSELSSFDSKR